MATSDCFPTSLPGKPETPVSHILGFNRHHWVKQSPPPPPPPTPPKYTNDMFAHVIMAQVAIAWVLYNYGNVQVKQTGIITPSVSLVVPSADIKCRLCSEKLGEKDVQSINEGQ